MNFMATHVYDSSKVIRIALRVEETVMLHNNVRSCLVEEEDYIFEDKREAARDD